MRLYFFTSIALLAFAANSILNRWALLDGATGAVSFALIRVLSGAIFLWILVAFNDLKWRPKFQVFPSFFLSIYILCFSLAYLNLGIGIGAVVLFGVVQLTMFGLAAFVSEKITLWRILGAIISFSGVCVLFLPNESLDIKINDILVMTLAAIGWGVYSFLGKSAAKPLLETTQNLVWAIPFVGIYFIFSPDGIGIKGFLLAVLSGAITSGLGYVIWYSILPSLKTSFAAILQLSVPIIAALVGVLFFSEKITMELFFATFLVILGTFVSLIKKQRKLYNLL